MDIKHLKFSGTHKQTKFCLKLTGEPDRSTLYFLAFIILATLTYPVRAMDPVDQKKWSLEAFQNWKNTDKRPMAQANAYTLLLSYRYFFYRNFHVELELWPAYNHFNSFVDGKTCKGLELWVEYKVVAEIGGD